MSREGTFSRREFLEIVGLASMAALGACTPPEPVVVTATPSPAPPSPTPEPTPMIVTEAGDFEMVLVEEGTFEMGPQADFRLSSRCIWKPSHSRSI